jgi:hypothetical protein
MRNHRTSLAAAAEFGSGPSGLSEFNAVFIGGSAPYVSSSPHAAYASGHGEPCCTGGHS